MKTAELVTVVVLLIVGGIVVYDSASIGIGWGTDGPRSGFFPFWLGVALIAASVAIGIQTLRRATSTIFVTRAQLVPVLQVLGPATALVVLTQVIGLYVSSALYLAVYMRWIGRHRWLAIAAISIGIPLLTFLIFEKWFLVPMPKGPLEGWLGY
ncbi:MAG: tricarboxylate transporter [Candidatus Rokuibacteriota bacterium]|nr:MAG: tricarboxylate transporter [Candidatus Rokubacteria bacterium]